MTLDETIQRENKSAEANQKIVDTEIVFDDVSLSQLYCDDTEVIEEHLSNYRKYAEYHKQIADWLELLKWYQQGMKDIPSESGVLPKDVYHAGYEKAIDDLIAKCESANFADDDETVLSDIHQGVNSGLAMAIHFAKELIGGKYEIN